MCCPNVLQATFAEIVNGFLEKKSKLSSKHLSSHTSLRYHGGNFAERSLHELFSKTNSFCLIISYPEAVLFLIQYAVKMLIIMVTVRNLALCSTS